MDMKSSKQQQTIYIYYISSKWKKFVNECNQYWFGGMLFRWQFSGVLSVRPHASFCSKWLHETMRSCLVSYDSPVPIGSMYGIFTYIYHKNQPNIGNYSIHGSYGVRNTMNHQQVGCGQISQF